MGTWRNLFGTHNVCDPTHNTHLLSNTTSKPHTTTYAKYIINTTYNPKPKTPTSLKNHYTFYTSTLTVNNVNLTWIYLPQHPPSIFPPPPPHALHVSTHGLFNCHLWFFGHKLGCIFSFDFWITNCFPSWWKTKNSQDSLGTYYTIISKECHAKGTNSSFFNIHHMLGSFQVNFFTNVFRIHGIPYSIGMRSTLKLEGLQGVQGKVLAHLCFPTSNS